MFLPSDPPGLRQRAIPVSTGITLNVVERPGRGAPVVCLHGLWAWWRAWRPLLPPGPGSFAGRPLLMPDLRGHGESGKPTDGYSLESAAADVVALIREQGIARLTLVGHSLGALIALLVAAALPDRVEDMLLEDPPLPLPLDGDADVFDGDGDASWLEFATTALELYDVKHRPLPEIAAALRERFPALPPEVAAEDAQCVALLADGIFEALLNVEDVSFLQPGTTLPMPTLVLRAGKPHDRMLGEQGIAQLRGLLPRMHLETIPDAGHWILGANPTAYRAAVAAFFERQDGKVAATFDSAAAYPATTNDQASAR